ncbi:MAG: PAS domain-containing protein [Symploca sp. SIO2B6]|nr:PAS domain-containing protein [Symploca sp. SIO2B6]
MVPFVIQIVAAVGLTGWFSFRNGQQAINDVTSQLRSEITAHINQKLESYLVTPHLVNQINLNAIHLGELDVENKQLLERHFWHQLHLFNLVGNIAYGDWEGEFTAVQHNVDNSGIILQTAGKFTNGEMHTYSLDGDGKLTQRQKVKPNFDPRNGSWYKNTELRGKAEWSEIFSFFSDKQLLVLPANQPLYDQTGKLLGVFTTGLYLSHISEFLDSLEVGKSGETFIIERDGLLVASSTLEPLITNRNTQVERIKAINYSNPLIRGAAQYLQNKFGNLSQIKQPQQLDFKLNDQRQFLQVLPFQDEQGLDWLIVVVVPEADFMERINTNTHTTIWLCLGALVLATGVGMITSRWISLPLLQLSKASQAIANGDLNQKVEVQRAAELGVLAQNFNHMAQQLQDSLVKSRESEERWKLALRGNKDGIWDWNVVSNEVFFSSRWKEIRGFAEDEIDNHLDEWSKRIHPDDLNRVMQAVNDHFAQKNSFFAVEYRVRRRDNSYIWILDRGQAIWDEQGNVVRMVGSETDISDRKQAEFALQESEERFRQLAENINEVFIINSADFSQVIYISPAYEQIWGRSCQSMYQKPDSWLEAVHPEDIERVISAFQKKAQGELFREEYRIIKPDRSIRWIFGRCFPVNNQAGEIYRYAGIAEDITERKYIEETLAKSRDFYLSLFEKFPTPIWRSDVNAKCDYFNEEWLNFTGRSFEQELGDGWVEGVHPDDVEKCMSTYLSAFKECQPFEMEYRLRNHQGEYRSMADFGHPYYDLEGNFAGYVGACYDITERQQAEAQLRVQTQQLSQALHELRQTQAQMIHNEKMFSLGQLLAGVAHEINNPISFIYGNLDPAEEYIQDLLALIRLYQQTYPQPTAEIENLTREIDLDFLVEDLQKLINSMNVGAERIRNIVLSLRNFSHNSETMMKAVDIHQGIDNTLTILRPRLKAQGRRPEIKVIKDYSKLPAVNCYAGELNQVFMNIISNGIDALEEALAKPEPPHPCIRIRTQMSDSNSVIIGISDNGYGISEQVIEKIFDPFFTTKSIGQGTGLGLAISHKIVVEKHQGKLQCISKPGKGTEFMIEIPISNRTNNTTNGLSLSNK